MCVALCLSRHWLRKAILHVHVCNPVLPGGPAKRLEASRQGIVLGIQVKRWPDGSPTNSVQARNILRISVRSRGFVAREGSEVRSRARLAKESPSCFALADFVSDGKIVHVLQVPHMLFSLGTSTSEQAHCEQQSLFWHWLQESLLFGREEFIQQ
jgi:hypothetical protein